MQSINTTNFSKINIKYIGLLYKPTLNSKGILSFTLILVILLYYYKLTGVNLFVDISKVSYLYFYNPFTLVHGDNYHSNTENLRNL